MEENKVSTPLYEMAERIAEMREICGFTVEEMAKKTQSSVSEYCSYEAGKLDLPFTFIHKCSIAFGIEITDLLGGQSARLSSYNVTRRGKGNTTVNENGIYIQNMASRFKKKLAEPYYCRYEYSQKALDEPLHMETHNGQEFDLIIEGSLKIVVGDHEEILYAGDSIYYNSSTPHGIVAVGGEDCLFLAMIMAGEGTEDCARVSASPIPEREETLHCEKYIKTVENEGGGLEQIDFVDDDSFNFAFDIVDVLGRKKPDALAMLHIDTDFTEKRFTFQEMKSLTSQTANYFKSLGIKKGDRVMLVLKRQHQFWLAILALHKIGAVAIPATDQLQEHDYVYRFEAAGVTAIVATACGETANQIDMAQKQCPLVKTKILAGGSRDGWHDFDGEYNLFSRHFARTDDAPCGDDPMIMFFTSGTTGYPKIATHSYKYALGHYITAKYWHNIKPNGLHFTISDTGWGKAMWGKLYGQWLCEAAVFVYNFDRFNPAEILPMFANHHITTFCAPPTMYRMLVKQDLSQYDLSSIKYATTAGEALNPAVYDSFLKATGLKIMEGFGQTETTLTIGNLVGVQPKIGSMGKPVPLYDIDILTPEGKSAAVGENGEIVIKTTNGIPNGLFQGYYEDEKKTKEVWFDGYYRTGDVAWRDEDGYFWYVGRSDDVIKSSGYRIGPFEIESVMMELPYILECGVSAAPDELRGQIVKASIVLTQGTLPSDALKKEIQDYVKKRTAPYKYPRIVIFRESLPKTISGKIQRNKL